MLAILIIEGVAIIFFGMLVVGLLRSHAEVLRTLHDLGGDLETRQPARPQRPTTNAGGATGDPAHDLRGLSLDGESVELGLVGAPADTLLAFLSATCYTCEPFWAALSAGVDVPNDARVVAVVADGDSRARLRTLAGSDLLVVISDAAWADYDVPGSPHFVYLDGPSGRVLGEGTASTWPQVRDLLEQATGAAPSPGPVSIEIEAAVGGRDNAERIDLELLAAGIGPGHPSLYPDLDPPHIEPPATG
jgi:hypothetical protein